MAQLSKGKRISDEQRTDLTGELVERYQRGESIRSLAESIGRSYGFVQGLLKEAGVEFRSRGGARTPGAAPLAGSPAEIRKAARPVGTRAKAGKAAKGSPEAGKAAKGSPEAGKAAKGSPEAGKAAKGSPEAGKAGEADAAEPVADIAPSLEDFPVSAAAQRSAEALLGDIPDLSEAGRRGDKKGRKHKDEVDKKHRKKDSGKKDSGKKGRKGRKS